MPTRVRFRLARDFALGALAGGGLCVTLLVAAVLPLWLMTHRRRAQT
jgi:hypothetical protein